MDIERLKKLTGQSSTLIESWKEVKVDTSTEKAKKSVAKKTKENNSDTKNKSVKDVSTDNTDVVAELVDTDDSTISPKDGKKDASGQKAKSKYAGERLYHTISIGDNGVPKVDDNTTIDTMDAENFGDFGEGFVVASTGNVYISEMTDETLIGSDNIDDALIFETIESAEIVANLFDSAEIRSVSTIEQDFVTEDQEDTVTVELEYQLDEGMRDEINDRIKNGKRVQLALQYNNSMITGHVEKVADKVVRIIPTAKSIKRFDIKDKSVIVPVDMNNVKWDEKHPDRIVGSAKSTNAPNPEMKVVDKEGKPGRGSKADFGQNQTQNKDNKPSGKAVAAPNWSVDMSSYNGPDGKSLNEMAQEIRTKGK